MIERILHYAAAFVASLMLTLLLTPVVREMNRRLGMIDRPDPRRINKVPIPRGGGLALYLGVSTVFGLCVLIFGESVLAGSLSRFLRLLLLATATMALGYVQRCLAVFRILLGRFRSKILLHRHLHTGGEGLQSVGNTSEI